LGDRLTKVPQFPEVVGDRKILRFLRGHDYDIEKVITMMSKFLEWRKDNKVDEIRQHILLGGRNKPTDFPRAEVILDLVPQIVLCSYARDKSNSPICIEKFNWSPTVVFQTLTLPEYIEFLIYALEYKSMVAEQISEELDRKYLDSLSPAERTRAESDDPNINIPPYGALVGLCVIRDLEGVGFDHIGARGQEIVSAIIKMSSDNYPGTYSVISSKYLLFNIFSIEIVSLFPN